MTRPLTGGVTANSTGTFTASVPARTGSNRRRTATFDTRAAAESWRADSILLLRAGQEVPPYRRPDRSLGPVGPASGRTHFVDVAHDYIKERYVEDEHGDVDREDQVTRYAAAIDAYLRHHGLVLEALTRRDVRTMWQHMLNRGAKARPAPPFPGTGQEELVTKKEALALLARLGTTVSDSTFKRAIQAGSLSATATGNRAHLFRVGDILAPEVGLMKANLTPEDAPNLGRYAHSTLVDVRRTFKAVIEHAAADGIVIHPGAADAKLPKNKTPKVRIRPLTFPEAKAIAGHLHAVHQLVLWLLAILGMRISEPYGLLVEDVIDFGEGNPGLIVITAQGGRRFRRRRRDKTTKVTDRIDSTKGRKSDRVLVVPPVLMDFIRLVIRTFHTDETGKVKGRARLIPGLRTADTGGQSSFRNAIKRAGIAEGIDITFELKLRGDEARGKVTPTAQALRQSYASALQADQFSLEDIRATLGQNLGSSVLHTNYLLDDPRLEASRRIAEATQLKIVRELGGTILTPTAVRCTTRRQPALVERAAEIDAELIETGWLHDGTPDGDWLTVADAAALMGVTEHQVRDDIRNGRLAGISVQRPDQAGQRHLVSAEAMAELPAKPETSDLVALALELGLEYDVVRQYVARHPVLALEREDGRRDGHLSEYAAACVREYFEEQVQLEERAVRITEVAKEFGVSVASIRTLIARNELVEDGRLHGGFRTVTRESVQSLIAGRAGRRRRRRS